MLFKDKEGEALTPPFVYHYKPFPDSRRAERAVIEKHPVPFGITIVLLTACKFISIIALY